MNGNPDVGGCVGVSFPIVGLEISPSAAMPPWHWALTGNKSLFLDADKPP